MTIHVKLDRRLEAGFFFVPEKQGFPVFQNRRALRLSGGKHQNDTNKESEVEVVRVRITLACTECKQRNYNTMKEKKLHPDRMETKKYCRFCRKHTMHKETK